MSIEPHKSVERPVKILWSGPGVIGGGSTGPQEGEFAPVIICDANDERASFGFSIPSSFNSVEKCAIWCLGPTNVGVNIDIDITVRYAQNGEAYNAHSQSDTTSTYNFTVNEITEIDITSLVRTLDPQPSSLFSVEVRLKQAWDDLFVYGVYMEYK
jgi:hypothetical protein